LDRAAFDRWLTAYGAAWEAKDTEAFTGLFTEDVRYHWTPFQPIVGRAALAVAFEGAVSRQKEIAFRYEIVTVTETFCLARWSCRLTRPKTERRVKLDGVLMVVPGAMGLCGEFREWWHSDEAP
jgi:ketosteroid isomerase-like protein